MKQVLFFLCLLNMVVSCTAPNDKELKHAIIEAGGSVDAYVIPDDLVNLFPGEAPDTVKALIELGDKLFHEKGIAQAATLDMGKGEFSCASCHLKERSFYSGTNLATGEGTWLYADSLLDRPGLKTPTAINSFYLTRALWDGSFGSDSLDGVHTQALKGQGAHRLVVNKNNLMYADKTYEQMFINAFGSIADSTLYTPTTAMRAIAYFENSLVTHNAPFQKWLRGDKKAMSEKVKAGGVLFMNHCTDCHNRPSFGGDVVLNQDYFEKPVGGKRLDSLKVPQLYNVIDGRFYGHSQITSSLYDAIDQHELGLSDPEIFAIRRFLNEGIYDKEIKR